jgi:transposase
MARGAGSSAVLNRFHAVFARTYGFEIDPCRAAEGSDNGKTERSVRTFGARSQKSAGAGRAA